MSFSGMEETLSGDLQKNKGMRGRYRSSLSFSMDSLHGLDPFVDRCAELLHALLLPVHRIYYALMRALSL
jgi:hypothetical protein